MSVARRQLDADVGEVIDFDSNLESIHHITERVAEKPGCLLFEIFKVSLLLEALLNALPQIYVFDETHSRRSHLQQREGHGSLQGLWAK